MSPAADQRDGERDGPERMFVSLMVAGQLCGIPVEDVRDVLGPQPITRIPLASPEIAGSLNLRGRIVTAIDLRRRLRLAPVAPGTPQMAIVTEQGGELYALLVDHVAEVLSVSADLRERTPVTMPAAWAEASDGLYRLQDQLMVVLDTARLFAVPARDAA